MKRYMIPDEECLPRYFADEPVADVGGGLQALPKLPPETITAMREAHRRDDLLYGTRLALQGRERQLLAALREVAELKANLATADDQYEAGFMRCRELAEAIVDEHDGFLDRISHLDPVTSLLPTPPDVTR